jgi:hypothetical protein
MHRRQYTVTRSIAAAVCAAALAACSSGGGGSGSTGTKGAAPPPQDVQAAVAASVAADVSSQITAMTTTGLDPFLALFNRVSNGKTPAVNLSHVLKRGTHARDFGPDCPTVTPATIVDTDHDGIPDSLAETYGSDCSETTDGNTETISGSLSFADATPNTPGLAYNSDINNFSIQESGSSGNFSLMLNGTLNVGETLSSITEAANYSFNFSETVSPNPSVTEAVMENLNATYSFPATSTLLLEGDPLPAGTFSIAGTESFTINSTAYSFAVATPTPLSVDPACTTGVTAGVLTVTFNGSSSSGTATITWTACGVYTVSDAS